MTLCFAPDCDQEGAYMPVILFGPGLANPEVAPYRLEVPKLVCGSCRKHFHPESFIGEKARSELESMLYSARMPMPDWESFGVMWLTKAHPAYEELSAGGEARFWWL